MSFSDPYQAYVEGSVFSGNPLNLVIALYEGTLDAVRRARECLATGDVWGRSKAISKSVELLTELLVSLDHKRGGEVSANLKRLYSYIQCRLLEAHARKAEAPLVEAERLLNTMLDGWRGAAAKLESSEHLTSRQEAESMTWREPTEHYDLFGSGTAEMTGCVSEVF